MSIRKLAVVLPLALVFASCGLTWTGQGNEMSEDARKRGIKDPAQMAEEYSAKTKWAAVRARRDGRVNAFGRDLGKIQDMIDRWFFNYSPTDPLVNYPTDETVLSELGNFSATFLAR